MSNNSELVYSTALGSICPSCGKAKVSCICNQVRRATIAQPAKNDGIIRVSRETQGRKGKGVSIISGLALTIDQLQELARELKTRCGCGGTVKNGTIEIQGDHRDLLVAELVKRGYIAKKAGG